MSLPKRFHWHERCWLTGGIMIENKPIFSYFFKIIKNQWNHSVRTWNTFCFQWDLFFWSSWTRTVLLREHGRSESKVPNQTWNRSHTGNTTSSGRSARWWWLPPSPPQFIRVHRLLSPNRRRSREESRQPAGGATVWVPAPRRAAATPSVLCSSCRPPPPPTRTRRRTRRRRMSKRRIQRRRKLINTGAPGG